MPNKRFDLTGDGNVSPEEIDVSERMIKLTLKEEKAETQKRMAWFSLILMTIVTFFLLSSYVPESRVSALSDLVGLFYIAQAGIVGTYMGVQAWMSKR